MRRTSYFRKKKPIESFDEKLEEMLDQKKGKDEILKYIEDKMSTLKGKDYDSYRPKMMMMIMMMKKGDDALVRQVLKQYRIHLEDIDNKPIQQYIVEQVKSNNADVVNYFYEPERRRILNDVTFSYTYTVRFKGGLSRLFRNRVYESEEGKLVKFAELNSKTLRALRLAGAEYGPDDWIFAVNNLKDLKWPFLNERDKDGLTPLFIAAAYGNNDVVRALLKEGARTDHVNSDGASPLCIAAYRGHDDVVRTLLEWEAHIEHLYKWETPLSWAARENRIGVVKTILDAKKEEKGTSWWCNQALFNAALKGHWDVLKILLNSNKVKIERNWLTYIFTLSIRSGRLAELINNNYLTFFDQTALSLASDIGHLDAVEALIAAGANKDSIGYGGETPVFLAAQNGHLDVVNALIQAGANLNHTENGGISPLYIAVQNGHLKVVDALIGANVDINQATTGNNTTPLWVAAHKGDLEMVKRLLGANADPSMARLYGKSPLEIAEKNHHVKVVNVLRAAGGDNKTYPTQSKVIATQTVEKPEDVIKEAKLWRVAAKAKLFGYQPSEGAIETAKQLRAAMEAKAQLFGWDVYQPNEDVIAVAILWQAVMEAKEQLFGWDEYQSRVDAARKNAEREEAKREEASRSRCAADYRFLDNDSITDILDSIYNDQQSDEAYPNSISKNSSPLELASQQGGLFKGPTALNMAVEGGHVQVVHELQDASAGAGADINKNTDITPLIAGIVANQEEAVEALLKRGANIEMSDSSGRLPLEVAVKCNNRQMVALLLRYKANPNSITSNKSSSLHIASLQGNFDIVDLLLDKGASPNIISLSGLSALHIASQRGYPEVVKRLIEGGARTNMDSFKGLTPLNLAIEGENVQVVQELLGAINDKDPRWRDTEKDNHPYYTAVRKKNIPLLKVIFASDKLKTTPHELMPFLRKAIKYEQLDAAMLLLDEMFQIPENLLEYLFNQAIYSNSRQKFETLCSKYPHMRGNGNLLNNWEGIAIAFECGDDHTMEVINQARTETNTAALCVAAKRGDINSVLPLLRAGAKIELNVYNNPLNIACKNGYLDVAKVLLNWGHNNNLDFNYETPLLIAAKEGKRKVVRALVEAAATTKMANQNNNQTPLYIAVRNGNLDEVKALLDAKVKVDIANIEGETPLHIAVRNGHLDEVKVLLDAKVKLDIANIEGETPLYIAARNGHLDVVKALLDAKVKVDKANVEGETPLHIAARNRHLDVVKALLGAGANKDNITHDGLTPLYIAALNGHLDVVKALLEAKVKVKVDIANIEGETPLHIAARNGHPDVVKALLGADANKNNKTLDGLTPLHIAAFNGHLDVVKALLEAKVKVDIANIAGETPLHIAARNGHRYVVEALRFHHANMDLAANDGTTPFYIAAQNGHLDVVKALIQSGAIRNNIRTIINNGTTSFPPSLIAREKGHVHVAEFIEAEVAEAEKREAARVKRYRAKEKIYKKALKRYRIATADPFEEDEEDEEDGEWPTTDYDRETSKDHVYMHGIEPIYGPGKFPHW